MRQGVWTSLWGWRQHLRSRLQTNSLGLSLRLGWVGSRWARKECAVDEENVSLNIRLFISSSDRHLEKLKLNLRWQNNGDRAHCIGYCHRFAAENTKKKHQKEFSGICRLHAIRLQWFNFSSGRTLLSKSSRRKVFPQMGHWANQVCLWKRWGGDCRGLWI